jgi:PPK2 family polyphosphate:nucleotide phosphotransferase
MEIADYRVEPGSEVRLADHPTKPPEGFKGRREEAEAATSTYNARLADLQQLLYAQARHKVLVVLQGMDTSGKDGTIKHVFRSVNPLGVRVANFKSPNGTELAHDYLWRVHEHTPSNGHITIFNRSHYEDVLVVRVHDLVPEQVWRRRYRHLREFERMLTDEGTMVLKFFLHISHGEQRKRLQERLDNPAKNWKFEHGDIEERKYWDRYQEAYEAALSETSRDFAHWYLVPSDKKWFRNTVIAKALVDALESLDMDYPEPLPDLDKIVVD